MEDKGTPRGQIHLQVDVLAGAPEVTLAVDCWYIQRGHIRGGARRLPVLGEALEKRCPGNASHRLPAPAEREKMEQLEPDTLLLETFARAAGAEAGAGGGILACGRSSGTRRVGEADEKAVCEGRGERGGGGFLLTPFPRGRDI